MVVQHNLTAMNSNRMLGLTTSAQAKSTEKLSSGYKINRAADDAAGLSISEKMRKQIRGLSQASLNAQDGISAVQTAEGALNEVQDMLQRMNELAVKAANGTMSENDRSYIQDEIKQLETEIDRVAETTKFNETYLLKGDKEAAKVTDYKYLASAATLNDTTGNAIADNTFFKEGEDTALSAADAKVALAAGEKLYKNAAVETPAEAVDGVAGDYVYTAASTAASFETGALTQGGTNGGESTVITVAYTDANGDAKTKDITFNSATAAAGTATALVAALNADDDLKELFTAAGDDGGITLTSKTAGTGKGAVTGVTVKTAGTDTVAIAAGTATAAKDKGVVINTSKTLFDADGNELTAEQAQAILEDGDTATKLYKESSVQKAAVEGTDYVFEEVALYDKDGNKISANGLQFYYDEDGNYEGGLYTDKEATTAVDDITQFVDSTQTKTGALTLKLHVGADATENNQISVDLDAMSAAGIGVKDLKVDGADDTNARNAIETIKAAIQQVSQQRSALGAVQNRLEHTIANLDNVVENTTAAESQIRDTDMATEMVKYSNNNILAQAGQAMLAQANQSNQGVLSLLG